MTFDRRAASPNHHRPVTGTAVGRCCVGLSRCHRVQAGQGCIGAFQLRKLERRAEIAHAPAPASPFDGLATGRAHPVARRAAHDRHRDTFAQRLSSVSASTLPPFGLTHRVRNCCRSNRSGPDDRPRQAELRRPLC